MTYFTDLADLKLYSSVLTFVWNQWCFFKVVFFSTVLNVKVFVKWDTRLDFIFDLHEKPGMPPWIVCLIKMIYLMFKVFITDRLIWLPNKIQIRKDVFSMFPTQKDSRRQQPWYLCKGAPLVPALTTVPMPILSIASERNGKTISGVYRWMAGKKAQLVKVLVVKADVLKLIPRTDIVEREPTKVSSDLHIDTH